jgi:hypothetical protein
MTDSHNLELISKKLPDENSDHALERRRVPRLCLTGELFRISQFAQQKGQAGGQVSGKIFSVTDLSPQGMGVRVIDSEDLRLFAVATLVQGEINLRRAKYPVQGRVKNIRGDIVGFAFEGISAEVQKVLDQYLDPVSLGQELRPIPSSEQGALWYHGPSGTDFLLWRSIDGQYRRMALYIQGMFVQWEVDKGITTGFSRSSDEKSEIRGLLRFETLMLDPDAAVDAQKTAVAKTVLLSSNLPQDLQKWCVRQLTIQ